MEGLTKDVRLFVKECQVYQASKHETIASPGLLQPLPIPEGVWQDISMDFISSLPKSNGYEVILVVIDRFMALAHSYYALQVAQMYLDNVFKLHGWPKSIVSDRDSLFLSQF